MRTTSRLLAGLVALALVAGGIIAAVEIGLALAGRDPWILPWREWHDFLLEEPWEGGDARVLLAALVAVGLVLLVVQLARWRPVRLPLRHADGLVDGDLRRSSVESALVRSAEDVDGVGRARVRLVGSKVRVRADSTRRNPDGVDDRLRTALASQLDGYGLSRQRKVAVRVRPRKD